MPVPLTYQLRVVLCGVSPLIWRPPLSWSLATVPSRPPRRPPAPARAPNIWSLLVSPAPGIHPDDCVLPAVGHPGCAVRADDTLWGADPGPRGTWRLSPVAGSSRPSWPERWAVYQAVRRAQGPR